MSAAPAANKENLTAGGNAAFHNYINDFAHVDDPLERRRLALEKIDNASFGWYHIRAILVAGIGFLTDAYDIFAINMAVTMMTYVYWDGKMPSSTQTAIKVSTSVGTVIGQLGFGFLGDFLGRKKVYGIELIIIITATIFQCMIGTSLALNFTALLVFWRIIMGIGIGGDYPLSLIITSEFATTKWRGAIMGAVFANQGWGQLLAGIVAIILVAGYKDQLKPAKKASECGHDCKRSFDRMWRVLVGFGCVPAVAGLYFRLTIPESPRFTMEQGEDDVRALADTKHFLGGQYGNANEEEIAGLNLDIERAAAVASVKRTAEEIENDIHTPPKASWADFLHHFGQWKHGSILLGTAGTWFMLDVAFYGLGLNSNTILEAIGYSGQANLYEKMYNNAAGNMILICAGSIPGYWVSVATLDTIGRKPIQIFGFGILTVMFCIMGFGYHKIGEHGLLGVYVICQFFQNFGPNTTTFIIPGEIFPTRYRSTAHGISAASGKVGAIVAQTALGTLINHNCPKDKQLCWLPHVLEIFALFMLLGFGLAWLVPETKRMSLEELSEKYHGEANIRNYVAGGAESSSDVQAVEEK